MYQYRATVLDWHDGDTLTVSIDLGFRIHHTLTIRLAGIDTPEINSPDPAKRTAAKAAKARAIELAPPGAVVEIRSQKPDPRDKYGRWLGEVIADDVAGHAVDVADWLIVEGLGVAYGGGKRA